MGELNTTIDVSKALYGPNWECPICSEVFDGQDIVVWCVKCGGARCLAHEDEPCPCRHAVVDLLESVKVVIEATPDDASREILRGAVKRYAQATG